MDRNDRCNDRWIVCGKLWLQWLSEGDFAQSQEFIKQVYTACNTRSAERLQKCDERLEALVKDNLVSANEQVAFRKILESAKSGEWETAQEKALEFAQRQVR